MQLSMQLSYAGGFKEGVEQVVAYEKAGLDLVWVAEAYTFDAPTSMGYLAARTERVKIGSGILPLYTRTPSVLAMTAAGLDALSDGRCVLEDDDEAVVFEDAVGRSPRQSADSRAEGHRRAGADRGP